MSDFDLIRLPELTKERRVEIIPKLDALFFEASNTQGFASADEKAAFRETWLGRYITHYPEHFYVVLEDTGSADTELLGYLAGCPDNPAQTPLFSDIEYFQLFENECSHFPATLHVNVAPDARGRGIGRALIDTYATQCKKSGIEGCHVITREGAHNVGYYHACGFHEVVRVHWQARDRTLVFLGKSIDQSD